MGVVSERECGEERAWSAELCYTPRAPTGGSEVPCPRMVGRIVLHGSEVPFPRMVGRIVLRGSEVPFPRMVGRVVLHGISSDGRPNCVTD